LKSFSTSRPFLRDFKSLGDYHDFFSKVLLSAPDQLTYSFLEEPVDQAQALVDAFDSLHRGLPLAKKKLKDERRYAIAGELLRMAYDFYASSARKQGIAALQEAEGLIWPSQAIKPNYLAEAERRVFGKVILYSDVKPRRYEGEVTIDQLGLHQRSLLEAARDRTLREIQEGQESCRFVFGCTPAGQIVEVKKASQKKTLEDIRRRIATAELVAVVRAELVFLGVLVLDLEERGQPLISARASLRERKLQGFRFFLDDPTLFPLGNA